MKKIKAALKAVAMTGWFVRASWSYIVTKRFGSKVEFFTGLLPAWVRFTHYTYKDIHLGLECNE